MRGRGKGYSKVLRLVSFKKKKTVLRKCKVIFTGQAESQKEKSLRNTSHLLERRQFFYSMSLVHSGLNIRPEERGMVRSGELYFWKQRLEAPLDYDLLNSINYMLFSYNELFPVPWE